MKIFNMNSPFHKYGALVFDLIVLNIIFIFFTAIGMGFTFGLAFIAATYTIYEGIRKEKGRLLYHFIKSIKDNYKQGLILSISVGFLSLLSTFIISNVALFSQYGKIVLVTQYFFLFELSIVSLYLFPLLAKINISSKEAIIHSFYLAHKHLLTSISCLSLIILNYYVIRFISPGLIVFSFGGTSYVIERLVLENIIIEKYLSEDMKNQLKIVEQES